MDACGVGVAILLINEDDHVLIGKRKGSHGAGKWGLPGGKMEFMVSAEIQVLKELQEETGIVLPSFVRIEPAGWSDSNWIDLDKGPQHWVTLIFEAEVRIEDNLKFHVAEPDKCEEWRWVPMDGLDDYDLFLPLKNYLVQRNFL